MDALKVSPGALAEMINLIESGEMPSALVGWVGCCTAAVCWVGCSLQDG